VKTSTSSEFAVRQVSEWIEQHLLLLPKVGTKPTTDAMYPSRPIGTKNPISPREFNYKVTIIAPICEAPVAFGWYTGSYNPLKFRGVASNYSTQFVEGYFGEESESVTTGPGEEYSRQHMLEGILSSRDSTRKTGVGPAAYMAGPLVVSTKRPNSVGTYSYRGGRSPEAENAWNNLIKHKVASDDSHFGSRKARLDTRELMDRVIGGLRYDALESLDLLGMRNIESVEPSTLEVSGYWGRAQSIERNHILELGIVLHIADDAIADMLRGYNKSTPFVPPPGIFQHLDLTYVGSPGVSLVQMVEFCAFHYSAKSNVSEVDYHRAALLALKDNPTNPIPEPEFEKLLSDWGVKRSNPAVKAHDAKVSSLLAFLSDPTWE
jgi:hypothetical protein